ncbi:PEP-utilizing enzyme [Patescibacteria group bacterium]
MSLFFITIPFDGCTKGLDAGVSFVLVKNGVGENILPRQGMVDWAESIVEKTELAEHGGKDIYQDWANRWAKHDEYIAQLNKDFFNELDLDKLLEELGHYVEMTVWMWEPAFVIDCFDPTGAEILQRDVFSQVRDLNEKDIGQLVSHQQLTTPAMLELAILKGVINNDDNLAQELQRQFHWMQNDYAGARELPVEHFDKKIAQTTEKFPTNKVQKERIEQLEQFTSAVLNKKKELFIKYELTPRQQGVLNLFADFTDWREERKRNTQKSNWVLQKFINALSEKLQIDANLIAAADPKELDLFKSDQAESVLQQRVEHGVIYGTDPGAGKHFLVDDPADVAKCIEMLDGIFRKSADLIRGNVAHKGVVKGVVKIINRQDEFTKFEQGDILVSAMTRPELMPVIHKAAGIITDEGGITCHAALVARELKIPCIIGTQNATLVLQDGDRVELNADKGAIRKIT